MVSENEQKKGGEICVFSFVFVWDNNRVGIIIFTGLMIMLLILMELLQSIWYFWMSIMEIGKGGSKNGWFRFEKFKKFNVLNRCYWELDDFKSHLESN